VGDLGADLFMTKAKAYDFEVLQKGIVGTLVIVSLNLSGLGFKKGISCLP